MPLKQCVECRYKVSDKAYICPSCERDPRGKECIVCKKIITFSDAVRVMDGSLRYAHDPDFPDASNEWIRHDKFLHKDCLLALFPDISVPCRDCRELINVRGHGLRCSPNLYIVNTSQKSASWSSDSEKGWVDYPNKNSGPSSCPHCGNPEPIERKKGIVYEDCVCALPVFMEVNTSGDSGHNLCNGRKPVKFWSIIWILLSITLFMLILNFLVEYYYPLPC